MHWYVIFRTLGSISIILSVLMMLSGVVGLLFKETMMGPFFLSAAIGFVFGIVFYLLPVQRHQGLSHKEAYALVTFSWFLACALGAVPYLTTGTVSSITDGFFESTSGFTTTGATVLTGLDKLPKAILFWRALTQWLGGMGIIVLTVAILPFLGVGGMEIYKAEVPSPVMDKLRPRIQDTAKALWKVYIVLSVSEFLLLWLAGLSPFDALCHTFTTMPTGGFSTLDSSIGGFKNSACELVIIFFMLIAGINFSLHYRLISKGISEVVTDTEIRWYLGIILISTLLILMGASNAYNNLFDAIRIVLFQVVSIMTTTGYVTYDYEKWPQYAQFILLFLMFIGAMAGSTGGAIKVLRIMLLVKHALRQIKKLIHPHAVIACRIGNTSVNEGIVSSVLGFYVLYLSVFGIGTILVSATGLDMPSSIGAVASCLGNVGPGFGIVGPMFTYKELSDLAKWILSVSMLMGRLELFTILVTMFPFYWKD